jgi:hypothetical protein
MSMTTYRGCEMVIGLTEGLQLITTNNNSAILGPGVYSASNRNEYQKLKNNNVSGE